MPSRKCSDLAPEVVKSWGESKKWDGDGWFYVKVVFMGFSIFLERNQTHVLIIVDGDGIDGDGW